MADPRNPNWLLVEGTDDLHAIAELMSHHVFWPEDSDEAPVYIKPMDGVSNLLKDDCIPLRLKSAAIKTLGVVLDADDVLHARWNTLRELCLPTFPGMPAAMPATGLILDNRAEGKRLGIWIMPDNVGRGMMETFASNLIRPEQHAVWDYTDTAFVEARNRGAACTDAHKDKARVHTFLAWQEPPCNSVGSALVQHLLDPGCAYVTPFVNWFINLYGLDRI